MNQKPDPSLTPRPVDDAASIVEAELAQKARAIHERVIVLDSHIDFEPADLISERNYTQRLETQFNLPNMIDGGVDALFLVVYVGQMRESQNPDALKPAGFERAYAKAVEKFTAVHRFTSEIAREQIELALNPADIRRIHANGKKAALIGVENGYPLGEDIGRVKEFYERGARYISLTHNGHNWAIHFPLIVQAVDALRLRSCLIDGEAVCRDEEGLPVVHKPRQRRDDRHLFLYAFDLREPSEQRKASPSFCAVQSSACN